VGENANRRWRRQERRLTHGGRTRLWAGRSCFTGIFSSPGDVIRKWLSGSYPLTEMGAIRSARSILILL